MRFPDILPQDQIDALPPRRVATRHLQLPAAPWLELTGLLVLLSVLIGHSG
ncbi:hypothetical protein [Rhodobacter ferrooxidans]|uniref:Uncharacterized protein n=1 Tax=Rhodobacter ferrooxidans TaxID=371731 RepID=C8RXX8_9RHOB|nr:hypothetical protein [Rhodobacter sp. SW2]EEW26376.1 hypothetical protein Rsw2DRAFT_0656 [Rhodobacter sp. SW2]